MGRPTAGWGSINCAGAGQPGRVWQARTAPGVAMLPGEAGINVRKTARYASKDCDPLHLRFPVDPYDPDAGDLLPSLHGRYPASALLRSSPPLIWRIGTFGLAEHPLVPFPLPSPARFSSSVRKPGIDSRLLYTGHRMASM